MLLLSGPKTWFGHDSSLQATVVDKSVTRGQNVDSWRDGGEPLDIEGHRGNVMGYWDANRCGNGWDGEGAS